MSTPEQIQLDLQGFIGSINLWKRRTPLPITYTDGVKYLQDKLAAFWLTDAIASYQSKQFKEQYEFQVWKLTVTEDNTGILTATDGNDDNAIVTQESVAGYPPSIEYTDFPLSKIVVFVNTDPDIFMFLPSEN
jgi:hypothetical protein